MFGKNTIKAIEGFKKELTRQKKRQVLSENIVRGKMGEEMIRQKYLMKGYDVERTPKGKDFTARKRNFLTGRVTSTKHVEVKTGKARLSKLQQQTKNQKKSNYKIERIKSFI